MAEPWGVEELKVKYQAERDKRMVDGRDAILDLKRDGRYAHLLDDPFREVVDRGRIQDEVDVVIVGGGIAGILVGVELRKVGVKRIMVIDQAGGFGGTWYWNRYPGVMCDIESYIYMPMLEEMDYIPSRRYASGEEILQYLEVIASRFNLGSDALFHTKVTRAEWCDGEFKWRICTDRGDAVKCRWYVLATGILNLVKLPAIAGMERFGGKAFHTARWDYEYTSGGGEEPLGGLADKVVGLVGNGASGLQCVPALAEAAKQLYVFQRTPSAIGVRGDRPTADEFVVGLQPGWQRKRMDNFQAVMLGRNNGVDLVDDGWTQDWAAVQHLPREKGLAIEERLRRAEEIDFSIMQEHRRRIEELVEDPDTAEKLKPYYRYMCKRPCFHDEYLLAFNRLNVRLVECPAGFEEINELGAMVDGRQYEVDCMIYGTGFEAELTPLPRRVGHEIVGFGGITLDAKWRDGAASLFGMMSRGFPNMFIMPAPVQQAVVTVNYTQLAVLGAEFIGRCAGQLASKGVKVFDVEVEAEEAWIRGIVESFVDVSSVLSSCTPSRFNNEGHPEEMKPRNGNYGRGMGDWFGYRVLLEQWLEDGNLAGLELRS